VTRRLRFVGIGALRHYRGRDLDVAAGGFADVDLETAAYLTETFPGGWIDADGGAASVAEAAVTPDEDPPVKRGRRAPRE
jgi:hypothetical protein